MKSKHLQKSFIPQHNPKKLDVAKTYINNDAALMHGWQQDGDKANIFISLRFVQYNVQCFSEWSKQEMKSFWEFLEKVHNYTWELMFSQSRKQDKSGLGYTVIPIGKYPEGDFKATIDPTCTFFELRVNEKARVHCFRNKSVCYICWLDKNHEVCG